MTDQEKAAPITSFQGRVESWMQQCFGAGISADKLERGDRLIEEVLELLQAVGYPPERVLDLISYVWSRPIGEPHQEVGGGMVTLAAFCIAHGIDIHEAGETELARVWTKVEAIRAKQAAKPTGSALPQHAASFPPVVTVLPLEWGETSYGAPEADTVLGVYRIIDAWDGGYAVNIGRRALTTASGLKNSPTIEEAKALAFADYERRIIETLAVNTGVRIDHAASNLSIKNGDHEPHKAGEKQRDAHQVENDAEKRRFSNITSRLSGRLPEIVKKYLFAIRMVFHLTEAEKKQAQADHLKNLIALAHGRRGDGGTGDCEGDVPVSRIVDAVHTFGPSYRLELYPSDVSIDGKPCSTDDFVDAVMKHCDDLPFFLNHWISGRWDDALGGLPEDVRNRLTAKGGEA